MRENAVQIENAAFDYPGKPVFSGISFSLTEGSLFCLLGPNGCGKTTLMKCLNGLEELKSGSVFYSGKDIRRFTPKERARISSFVFQSRQDMFAYSVFEIVLMGRGPHIPLFRNPGNHDRELTENTIRNVGLNSVAQRKFFSLSGGEQQLAIIARALVQEPEIIFLDEPTSHLDFGNQLRILETVKHLTREQNLTVIMSTHVPDHAIAVADTVALMKNGAFTDFGPPAGVLTEAALADLYGVETQIMRIGRNGRERYCVVPVMDFGNTGDRGGNEK